MTDRKLFDVQHLPLEDIDPDPEQPRTTMTGIDTLAASIREYGQLTPIRVRQTGNRYRIIGGERRFTAMKQLGEPTIAAFVADSDDAEVALMELADNLHMPLTDDEVSRGTQRVFTFDGVTPERIAAATGTDVEMIAKAQRGYRAVGDAAVSEQFTLERLVAIDEFADDPEAVKLITEATERDWKMTVQDVRRARNLVTSRAEAEATVTAAGAEVGVEWASGMKRLGETGPSGPAPEGATHAYIQANSWSGACTVYWFATRGEEEEPDPAEAKRDEAERERKERDAALAEASHRRLAHIRAVWNDACKSIRELAVTAFDGGCSCDARHIPDELEDETGLARFLAAIVGRINAATHRYCWGSDPAKEWGWNDEAPSVAAYLLLLKSTGLELDADEMRVLKAARKKLAKEAEGEQ